MPGTPLRIPSTSLRLESIPESDHLYEMWHYPSPPLARVSSVGTKLVSSHISKTVRLQAPSIVKGALNFWLHRAAIILTRPFRRPDFSAWNRLQQHLYQNLNLRDFL
jgi:hypothetical protein